MTLNAERICVVGLKRSGVALCDLLLSEGKRVKVTDMGREEGFSPFLLKRLREKGVVLELGRHSQECIADCDLVVISPGVDRRRCDVVRWANRKGIPVIGEMEAASRVNRARIVAVTGTNGKTTTTFLAYLLLKEGSGRRTFLAGNIGIPFSQVAAVTGDEDIVVLEVSSFQLEDIREFHPHVSCITNIEADHLDRYGDIDAYITAKKNIFRNQTAEDFAVLNRNSPYIERFSTECPARIRWYHDEFSNANYAAAASIARIFGVSDTAIGEIFSSFRGLPHRLQEIGTFCGVTFINDSKATNPSSTIWALKNINRPIQLIAGGKDKGLDYTSVVPYLKKVKKVYVYGAARDKIVAALEPEIEIARYQDLQEATLHAAKEAHQGDVVLLSPMCASFDQFKNYQERGRVFIAIVTQELSHRGDVKLSDSGD